MVVNSSKLRDNWATKIPGDWEYGSTSVDGGQDTVQRNDEQLAVLPSFAPGAVATRNLGRNRWLYHIVVPKFHSRVIISWVAVSCRVV